VEDCVTAKLPKRVPPAISYRFQQFVESICEKANIDYEDRQARSWEWRLRLEELFWRFEAKGSDDEAAEAAQHAFGKPEEIIRSLKGGFKGWLRRLLTYARYRTMRFILIVLAAQMVEYLYLEVHPLMVRARSFADGTFEFQFPLFSPKTLYRGVAIVFFATFCSSSRFPRILRIGMGLAALYCQFVVLFRYCARIDDIPGLADGTFTRWIYWSAYALLAPLLLLSVFCLLAEVFRFPERARHRLVVPP
jgi:hypothetical protein